VNAPERTSIDRRLLVRRRLCPPAGHADYDRLWKRLILEADGLGARAWRFRAETRDDLFVEFLEFPATSREPRLHPGAAELFAALDEAFGHPPPAAQPLEAWREANP
jgi:hypothetical protein